MTVRATVRKDLTVYRKMNCFDCKRNINQLDLLKCSRCKIPYHYRCLNITSATFREEIVRLRSKFRCVSCMNVTQRNRVIDETLFRDAGVVHNTLDDNLSDIAVREKTKENDGKMTTTVKCSQCAIVIDEMLCFIQNKLSVIDDDGLIRICVSAFSAVDIKKSKALLFDAMSAQTKNIVRKQKDKEKRDVADIIALFKSSDPDVIPIFVARQLEKLPPVTFDHLDVTKLLKDLTLLKEEVRDLRSTCATVEQLEKVKTDLQFDMRYSYASVTEHGLNNVNTKRGGSPAAAAAAAAVAINISSNESSSYVCMENIKQALESSTPKQMQPARSPNVSEIEGRSKVHAESSSPPPPPQHIIQPHQPEQTTPVPMAKQVVGTSFQHNLAQHNTRVCISNDNNNGWQVVTSQKTKQKYRYAGKKGVAKDAIGCFWAAENRVPMFITNVQRDSAPADIKKHIKMKTNVDVHLEKLSLRKRADYDAYKFFVTEKKVQSFLDENIWPQGIIFRRFVHYNNKRSGECPSAGHVLTNDE